ncbi:MAG: RNA polymerase sigma factor FliA [Pseudomonadales bacterium]|nr:RNA polymerase sigma factor FliA [Pseudomonadales bacterium]
MTAADGINAYTENRTPETLVREYATLVKRIAHHLMSRLPSSVQPDDLIQSGMIGLLEAASKYDPTKGASFETYAGIRIRGSMLDEIRKGDWIPRSVHRNVRGVTAAMQNLEKQLGRGATDREVADEMGVSLSEYFSILKDSMGSKLFSFDEMPLLGGQGIESKQPGPLDQVQKSLFQRSLALAIGDLPEREQLVLSLYYDDELNLKEIGQVLGVSESRVSQIHTQATLRLRSKLKSWTK